MRKVVTSLFISLDGVVESPDQWQFDGFDGDMLNEMMEKITQIDTVLLGRITYEEWASYWPTSDDESFASFINKTPKLVASTTLDTVEWGSFDTVSLIEGDLGEAITQLKQQPGKNIGVNGSVSLVQWLLEHNLLDELQLTVHPVIAGKGRRLFKDGSALKRLKLVESKTTSSGVAILTYGPHA